MTKYRMLSTGIQQEIDCFGTGSESVGPSAPILGCKAAESVARSSRKQSQQITHFPQFHMSETIAHLEHTAA